MPLAGRSARKTPLTARPRFLLQPAMRLSGGSKRRFQSEEKAAAGQRQAKARDIRLEIWKDSASGKGIDVSNISTREQLAAAIRLAVFPTDEKGRRLESSVHPYAAKSLYTILRQIEG